MISQDARINALQATLIETLQNDDAQGYLRALNKLTFLTESFLVQTDAQAPVKLTQKIPLFPLPKWMGLEGIGFAMNEPFLVAAPPGNGKTLFLYNIAAYISQCGLKVTIYHNELRAEDYAIGIYRVAQNLIPGLGRRLVSVDDTYKETEQAEEWLRDSGITIITVKDDGPRELISRMTKVMSQKKADIILFDWLQNIKVNDDNMSFKAYSFLAQKFERLCDEFKIPVGVFAQLNREGVRERILGAPGQGTVEGCPKMEQKSGLQINLRNAMGGMPQGYSGTNFFWLNVCKNRRGPVGQRTAKVDFRASAFVAPLDEDEMESYLAAIKRMKK